MRYPVCEHTSKELRAAGKLLGRKLDTPTVEVIDAFRVAHAWRAASSYPMHRLRTELAGKVRRGGRKGLTAARLKRMESIRAKLYAGNRQLHQIQDIAGCRAVVDSMSDLRQLQTLFQPGMTAHELKREDDYIEAPRVSGYRCLHQVLKFSGEPDRAEYSKHIVEVQLRTRIQHVWATAVEAIGLITGDNLKAGQGDPNWLRFLLIVSGEMAVLEGTAIPDRVPVSDYDRRNELAALVVQLDAMQLLEQYRYGVQAIESYGGTSGGYFILKFNPATKSVKVDKFSSLDPTAASLIESDSLQNSTSTVFVEVDEAQSLRAAFPNYFLDLGRFREIVQRSLAAQMAQQRRKPVHKAAADLESPPAIAPEPKPTPARAPEVKGVSGLDALDFSWIADYRTKHRK